MFDAKDGVIRLASKSARLLAAYRLAILTLAAFLIAPSSMLADCRLGFDSASHLDVGFASLYDLSFDAAQTEFSDWKVLHPDDPLGPTAAASAYLFQEFDRLGVLQSELFRDDQTFQQRKKLTPDPRLKNLLDSELVLAEMLAANSLRRMVRLLPRYWRRRW